MSLYRTTAHVAQSRLRTMSILVMCLAVVVLVVSRLGEGSQRFNELRRGIGNISQKMLTTTLRQLERDGFVTRGLPDSAAARRLRADRSWS